MTKIMLLYKALVVTCKHFFTLYKSYYKTFLILEEPVKAKWVLPKNIKILKKEEIIQTISVPRKKD